MNLKSRVFIGLFFILLPNFAVSYEIKCQIDKAMTGHSKSYLEKWISSSNSHFVDGNKIIFNNKMKSEFLNKKQYAGKILENSSNKIIWNYRFENTIIKTPPAGRVGLGRGRNKNSIFIIKFELRKKNNILFFESTMDKEMKDSVWVEGMGKCQIIEKPKVSEKDIKLEAEKLAKEKTEKEAKQEAELKAQILAEEKAKQEAKFKAQIIEEEKEKLKEELRKKIRAELKEKQLAKERAKLRAKKQAQEQARLAKQKAKEKAQQLANEKARLAKEKAKKQAQKLAREQARIKAEKLAKEKAKKEAVRKAQNKKDFLEHLNMISDIQLFLSKGSSFDPVKIANLFVKFNGLAQGKWTSNTFKAYRDLKNYALSFDEFKNFMVEQEVNRENLKQEKINKLSDSLKEKSKTLKEFITKNLTSKKTPRALELISKIEKILPSENIKKLDKLNQEVGSWISNINDEASVNTNNKSSDKLVKKNNLNKEMSFDERFTILKNKLSYKEGKCLGTILYAARNGWKMSKWAAGFILDQNNPFQSYITNFIKNKKVCKSKSLKTAVDVDNKINCIANFYKQTKGFTDQRGLSYARFTLGMFVSEFDAKRYQTPFAAFNAVCLDPDLQKNNVVKKQKPKTKPNVQNSIAMKAQILDFKKQTAYRCYDSVPSTYKDVVMSTYLRSGNDYYMKARDEMKNNRLGTAKTFIDTAGMFYDNSIKQSQQFGATNC